MAKQEFYFPANVHEYEIQLLTFIAFIGLIAGFDSILTKQLSTWITHLHDHYASYESQSKSNLWLTRILFSIDLLVQEQLQYLQDIRKPLEQVSWQPIFEGFQDLQYEIIRRRLNTTLPDSLIQTRSSSKKRKSENDNEQNKKANYKDDRQVKFGSPKSDRSSSSPTTTVSNNNRNSQWAIPSGKTFSECFINSGLINECPKYNDTPFCLQFHTKGFCTRGANCRLAHDDPRTVRLDRNFNAFIDKAYKRNSPASPTIPSPQPST
jgi:hypothetical protein